MKEKYVTVSKIIQVATHVAIHNEMVIYRCLPNNKNMDTLKFRLSLAQGLMENTVLLFLILYMAVCHLSRRLRDSQSDISWSVFPPQERRQNL
jgi:hypothetical protein